MENPYITVLQLPLSLCVKAQRISALKKVKWAVFAVNLGGTAGQPVPFFGAGFYFCLFVTALLSSMNETI